MLGPQSVARLHICTLTPAGIKRGSGGNKKRREGTGSKHKAVVSAASPRNSPLPGENLPNHSALLIPPSPHAVEHFEVSVLADLVGFRALGPPGGFSDTSVAHFFQLKCVGCGDLTKKDVCLYTMPPGTATCTNTWGVPGEIPNRCYPTCKSSAHIVRKVSASEEELLCLFDPFLCNTDSVLIPVACKGCYMLGSVELIPGGAPDTPNLHCVGYATVAYCPGSGWVLTTTAGEIIQEDYFSRGGNGEFRGNGLTKEVEFLIRCCDN